MNKVYVYLSGATKNVHDHFQNWRLDAEFKAKVYENIKFINPLKYFNYNPAHQPKTDKQCLNLFTWQVERSELLLVNLDHSEESIGTAMEVEHAYCHGIPVIAFGSQENTWYNWVKERATVVFEDLDEACFYIKETYVDTLMHE